VGRLLDALEAWFRADGWPVLRDEGDDVGAIHTRFQGEHGSWACVAQAREREERLCIYSVLPISVPLELVPEAAEFLTRANFGLLVGSFEMDWDDGEVRFKTGFDVEGTELTPQLIRPCVYTNVLTTDRYLPGLLQLVVGTASPAQAVAAVEASPGR
jgi:hypothetical protein